MLYEVLWCDCEDEMIGNPFKIEGENPKEAYFKACDKIRSWSPYLKEHFCGIDIEYLVDENDKYYDPDEFLKEGLEKKVE